MADIIAQQSFTVRGLIDEAAAKYGSKTFIKYCKGSEIIEKTYEDVRRDSLAVCRYIRSISKEHIHIAIIGKTNYEYITVMTGALLSGNTVVPLASDMTDEETVALLEHSDSDMLFCEKVNIAELCPRIKYSFVLGDSAVFEDIYRDYSENSEYASLSEFEIDDNACCLIMYTSGTTGEKKGVMLSMRALISNTNFKELSFTPDDVTLSVLPMHHIFCFSSDYLKNIKDGVTVCLNGDVGNISRNLLLFEPTIIRLVPVMTKSLLRQIRLLRSRNPDLTPREAAEKVYGRRIRWITSSSAYLAPSVIEEYESMGIKIRQAYGMTEAGPRISVPDSRTSPESVGRVISSVEVHIAKGGEIQVSGPSIMIGYYKDPAATREMLSPEGYLRTGDIGHVSEDGELYITGRLKNLIILSNGENISPEVIEKKYANEPLVKEIMVYEKNDTITADVFPDCEYVVNNGITDIKAAVGKLINRINVSDTAAHEINTFTVLDRPLDRTSSGKLIRKCVKI